MTDTPRNSLTGLRFGKLLVGETVGVRVYGGKRRRFWMTKCDCGAEYEALHDSLVGGNTKSCGCLSPEASSRRFRKHGRHGSREYLAWAAAKQRCTNRNHPSWWHYGGRGITMCDAWLDSFETFLADMGEAPEGLELERIDNDGPYAPWNCTWATRSQQVKNQRRHLAK